MPSTTPLSHGGPRVRIPFPPAKSPLRNRAISPSRYSPLVKTGLLRPKGNAVAVTVVDDMETPLSFESGGAGSAAHPWAAVRPPLACRSSCAGSARGAWSPSPAPPDAPSRQEAPASPVSAECSTQGAATVYARVTRRGQVSSFMPFCTPGREPIRSPQACRCFSPALSGSALRPA